MTTCRKTVGCTALLLLAAMMAIVFAGCSKIKAGTYYYCSTNGNIVHILDDKYCDVAMTPVKGSAENMVFKNCTYTVDGDKMTVVIPLGSIKTQSVQNTLQDIVLNYNITDSGKKISESGSGSEYSIISESEYNAILSRNKSNTLDLK